MNKFEKLITLIINEDQEKAQKLFHTIVVEQSRKIYEGLIDEEDLEEADGDNVEDMVDDVEADEEGISESLRKHITANEAKQLLDYMDGTLTESNVQKLLRKVAKVMQVPLGNIMESLEEASDEILDVAYDDDAEMGDEGMDDMGDMGDEGIDDMDGDDLGGMDDMGGEEEIEDRVVDLEDALDELKAEFDELMAAEEGEGHEFDDEGLEGEEGEEDFGDEDLGDEEDIEADEEGMDDVEEALVREYVEKVSAPSNSEAEGTNKKSTVAGKNDMGGTSANILGSNVDEKGMKAKAPGNLPHAGSFENDPKAKAGKTWKPAKKPASKESGADKKSVLDGPKGK